MFDVTWWFIAGYVIFYLVILISFDIYLKRKVGEGIMGQAKIPKKFMWVFVLGMIGTWIILLIPLIFLFYSDIVDILLPISVLRGFPFDIIGWCFISGGCFLLAIAMVQLGLSARVYLPGKETKLVTSGIYKFCRNPAYMGYYLSTVGVFFLIPSVIFLIGFILFLINQHLRILQEEKFLSERFGVEYENYKQKVGRYFP